MAEVPYFNTNAVTLYPTPTVTVVYLRSPGAPLNPDALTSYLNCKALTSYLTLTISVIGTLRHIVFSLVISNRPSQPYTTPRDFCLSVISLLTIHITSHRIPHAYRHSVRHRYLVRSLANCVVICWSGYWWLPFQLPGRGTWRVLFDAVDLCLTRVSTWL